MALQLRGLAIRINLGPIPRASETLIQVPPSPRLTWQLVMPGCWKWRAPLDARRIRASLAARQDGRTIPFADHANFLGSCNAACPL
jgi:hypothetical protein